MNFIKSSFTILVTILILVSIGIFILEILFGDWLFNKKWQNANYLNIIRDYKSSTKIKDKSQNKNEEYNILYTRNIYGLRGSCKEDEKIDILVIGGSTTDQRYISDEYTFNEILQNLINKNIDKKICVFNAGVDGHSTHGHIQSYKYWFPLIPKFKPRIVLLYIGINDAGFRNDLNNNLYKIKKLSFINQLKSNSAFYKGILRIRYIYLSLVNKNIYGDHLIMHPKDEYIYNSISINKNTNRLIEINTENFNNRLSILLKQIKKYESDIVCINQPHFLVRKFNKEIRGIDIAFNYKEVNYNGLDFDRSLKNLNKMMKKICEDFNGYFLELNNSQFNFHKHFYDPVHMNTAGNRKLGEIIYKKLKNDNILDILTR